MLTLYQGSGSGHYWVDGPVMSDTEWADLRHVAASLLTKRGHTRAAKLLETLSFEIAKGANDFGDDFSVLHRTVSLNEYVEFEGYATAPADRLAFTQIAKTITELGTFIRFIGVELSKTTAPQPVSSPVPKITSQVVERALIDAEQLIKSSGPVSAVDRAHTALHGYLKQVCLDVGAINGSDDHSMTALVKVLKEKHPVFSNSSSHSEQIEKVLRAMSVVVDALNPLRNRGSVAHANQALLDEADAMLAVNAARTVLHYVDAKLQSAK